GTAPPHKQGCRSVRRRPYVTRIVDGETEGFHINDPRYVALSRSPERVKDPHYIGESTQTVRRSTAFAASSQRTSNLPTKKLMLPFGTPRVFPGFCRPKAAHDEDGHRR